MEIITENGKDYLVTSVAKIDNSTISAGALFTDVQEVVTKILKKYNNQHKTKNLSIYQGYGSNLQSLLNRYSGDYFSPSFMKELNCQKEGIPQKKLNPNYKRIIIGCLFVLFD